ncbi:MAG: hypothetical protein K2X78_09140 [Burkholderiaceae bacterium]|nr:hypothetical protein [Burkholderiaceae bacterium]
MLAWLARLLPKQEVRGERAVQVGRVDGDLNTDHSTHRHNNTRFAQSVGAVHMGQVCGSVHNSTQTQRDGAIQVGKVEGGMQVVHQHFYPATATHPPMKQTQPVCTMPADQHKQVVSQILKSRDQLKDRELSGFKRFMEREFKTQLVKAIPHSDLHRVQSYLAKTIRNREKTQ